MLNFFDIKLNQHMYLDEYLSPYEVMHHSTMLNDSIRLQKYNDAIKEIISTDTSVVEIGSGTGILSALICEKTNNKISSIEYFKENSDVARYLLHSSGYDQIQIINKSSYSTQLNHDPTVLVTETIGSIGPEENIVELCYDFTQRHPSINTLIPARLKLFAIEIISTKVEEKYNDYINSFTNLAFSKLDFRKIEAGLEKKYCEIFHPVEFNANEIILGKKTLLADYKLGHSKLSNFQKELRLDDSFNCNGIHLFFEAELSPSIVLSSSAHEPLTHWKHTYIKRPKNETLVNISYSYKTNKFVAKWY